MFLFCSNRQADISCGAHRNPQQSTGGFKGGGVPGRHFQRTTPCTREIGSGHDHDLASRQHTVPENRSAWPQTTAPDPAPKKRLSQRHIRQLMRHRGVTACTPNKAKSADVHQPKRIGTNKELCSRKQAKKCDRRRCRIRGARKDRGCHRISPRSSRWRASCVSPDWQSCRRKGHPTMSSSRPTARQPSMKSDDFAHYAGRIELLSKTLPSRTIP